MKLRQRYLGAASAARTPLYRNGIALVINSGTASLIGYAYWIVAARSADPPTIGQATALVAALMALSAIAQLSLPSVLVTYLPRVGESARKLVLTSYGVAAVNSAVLGFAFAVLAPRASSAFSMLSGIGPAALFAVSVAIWSLFALQDNALTGIRRAPWVPIENALYGAAKLVALIAIGAGISAIGLLATWVIPACVALVPVTGALLLKLLPHHAKRDAPGEDLAGLRRYFAADSTGLILSQLSVTLLPVLVVIRLGADQAAAFAIAWLIVQSVDLLAVNLGMSLTVEGAFDDVRLHDMHLALRRQTVLLVAIIAIAGIALAPEILRLFGSGYADSATAVLRILLLASVGRAVVVLALCAARARRDTRRILRIQVAIALLVPTAAWLFGGEFGIEGVATAWALANVLVASFVLSTEHRHKKPALPNRVNCALLVNHWHDDNKGDSAITAGIIKLLREQWPEATVRLASMHERDTRLYRGVSRHLDSAHAVTSEPSLAPTELGSATRGAVNWRASLRWMFRMTPMLAELVSGFPRAATRRRFDGADLVIAVGGSNIYDDPKIAAPLSLARLMQVLYPVWAAGRIGVPCILAGHTLGPFPRRSGRIIARRMLRDVDRAVLRESTSLAVATSLGLKNVVVRPDMAFATAADRTRGVAAIIDGSTGGRTVAVAIRQHPHLGAEADAKLVDGVRRALNAMLERGLADSIVVVAHSHGPTDIEDDRPISRQLCKALEGRPVKLVDDDLSPSELAALYGACDLVISVRLHAAIIALAQGTPAFAISYFTKKTEGVMSDAGLRDAWCDFEHASPDLIVSRSERLLDPAAREELNAARKRWLTALRSEAEAWIGAGAAR